MFYNWAGGLMQITEDTIPMCVKCKTRKAICYMNRMWVCGQCIHEYNQNQIKLKQTAFLEG